jgi:hypothetical protein
MCCDDAAKPCVVGVCAHTRYPLSVLVTHGVDARAHVRAVGVERRLHEAKLLGRDQQLARLAKLFQRRQECFGEGGGCDERTGATVRKARMLFVAWRCCARKKNARAHIQNSHTSL